MFGGELDKVSLQKLLFLFTRKQELSSFHFIPYKFGCYSFQANADLGTMSKYNQVEERDSSWIKIDETDYFKELKNTDQLLVQGLFNDYKEFCKDDLIRLTYLNFPYYAINSTIVTSVLNKHELAKVDLQRVHKTETVLFTIGYEGVSLEEYINKLIANDVRVLCDVRKNPLSMKFGFSKGQLQKACVGVGIEYVHIPEVGIESDKRRELNSQADYDSLFVYYRASVLKNEVLKQNEILTLLETKGRIALTCFEANVCHCHRKYLAESIASNERFRYELKHL